MRTNYYYLLLTLITINVSAQLQNQWIWLKGETHTSANSDIEFGITGVENTSNWPGIRQKHNMVAGNDGLFWIFGGKQSTDGSNSLSNELWVYNPANNTFTFKKGSLYPNSPGYSKGVNIPHYRNAPRPREASAMWASGNSLYLFSGSDDMKNDFWRYDMPSNTWRQLNAGTVSSAGNFGVLGVESATNIPPSMANATTWTDNSGNLWLFGGNQYDTNTSPISYSGYYNSLWKYNIQTGNWVWISGLTQLNTLPNQAMLGAEHLANNPGGRAYSHGWTDAQGNLWLIGGNCTNNVNGTSASLRNDVWKFNPATNLWTWVRASSANNAVSIITTGTEHAGNTPRGTANYTPSWKDNDGNFWAYGMQNDQLWKYNPVTNNWTFLRGSTTSGTLNTNYGTMGVPALANTPGYRTSVGGCTSLNGDLYIYSGENFPGNYRYSDVWRYNIATNMWTWIKGCNTEVCEKKVDLIGLEYDENSPGKADSTFPSWKDSEGNLWLFSQSGSVNEHLWKYNSATKKWRWIKGEFSDYYIPVLNYPEAGTENSLNSPRFRRETQTWTDLQGNLWLMGGYRQNEHRRSDLWKYNKATNNWVFVKGPQTVREPGVYGTQGVSSPANMPGARIKGRTWTDNAGSLWLFGGHHDSTSGYGPMNDLWKFNTTTNEWTWVKGGNTVNAQGFFAGTGVADPANSPVAYDLILYDWKDNSGNLYLITALEIWKFDIQQNSWIGVKAFGSSLNYGTLNVPAATNSPGPRYNAETWKAENGDLILYGGSATQAIDYLKNDIWRFSIATNMWIWTGGTKRENIEPSYGTQGQANYSNHPGARSYGICWSDNNGNRYLYGGRGFNDDDFSGFELRDLWVSNGQFNTISGNIRHDANNNGCTATDSAAVNIKVTMQDGANTVATFTDANGNYKFYSTSPQVTVSPENTIFTSAPASSTFNFTGFQNTQGQDFCLTSAGVSPDVQVQVIPLNAARPGFDANYKIVYTNKGNTTTSGTIQFTYPDTITDLVSSAPAASQQNMGSLVYNFSNLLPFQSREVLVTLNINSPMETPAVNGGDNLPLQVSAINNNDINTADNNFTLNQEVVNAFDPNDKTCLEGRKISESAVGGYVSYVIRFENTGTANAVNIVIEDDIDTASFLIETLAPVSSSHPCRTEVTGNRVRFIFEGIQLPFFGNLRHGYISFKIKTKPGLIAGDIFSNKANIYFDYNFPIITNSADTQVDEALSTVNPGPQLISVYPNPVKDILYVNSSETFEDAVIYDSTGRKIRKAAVHNNTVNVAGLEKGIYFVTLMGNSRHSLKIIKE